MAVGSPLPHDAAKLHVTGQARYIDDIPMPANTLHLAFGLSSVAHGDITAMELDAVRAAEGVVAVMTAEDFDGEVPDCSPSLGDEPLLTSDVVHYVGQPVFLVIATSHLAARRAVRLAKIDYDERPAILDYDTALREKSHFEDGPRIYSCGDAAKAIAGAPHRIEGTIEMGGQEHFYLEGQAAAALPQEGGDMIVYSSTQHPSEVQHKVAHALHVPMHAVRVETRRMGGGFGGKESQGNWLAIACAVAARATGRPCKMRYDRDDDMIVTGKRHDFRISYTCGFDGEGRILGIDFLQLTRAGWSMDLTLPVADRAMLHADNAYFLPNARIESHRLRLNTQSNTAYRGFGGPQGVLGIERVIDHIAHTLGRDPAEVRRLNYYDEMVVPVAGEGVPEDHIVSVDYDPLSRGGEEHDTGHARLSGGRHSPRGKLTPYGQEVEDFILHGMTERLLSQADWSARRRQVAEWNARNPILKKGLGISPVKFGISFTLTHLNQAGALVHVYSDGSLHLNHGGTEMGQGLFQKVAQVAASEFGIGIERVKITATDTGKVPNTSATAASSGSDLNGMAVKNACDRIRTRLEVFLLDWFGDSDVTWQDGRVRFGNHDMSFEEVVKLAYMNRVSLSATGYYKTPKIEWDRIAGRGRPFFYFAHGIAISEVVLDTLTGENRILRADILHDVGNSLNPAIDIGQIEGGYVQGAGWLTTEELVWDAKGRLRTHAPSTYKIPAASDAPDVFNITLWDGQNREETIYRSKAVGEPPFMLGISAFLALSDAAAACGPHYPALNAPATPEECLAAIARARGEAA
ncbi:xanthine dehydrogenase molybdopterin binding subunit [Celeribacter indicus]|uniref:Xanthine dehydrogenase molybdenum-binding subunit n=1 Tax=Celeribacter indicus TaxID=1208324 RepID=A0A0B5E666_9RHOB|nr:xanthine dehydrogenase molybdopterin binding subunit [Celeribacter indicus]AJE48521.1 xanthine dehydrogenase molybdenum-binding subunit [Celeribacter indicus]SDX07668.1 xanthine dehydrogenase, molybdenum binding subunit apoprotein [Celeribacter indicus]